MAGRVKNLIAAFAGAAAVTTPATAHAQTIGEQLRSIVTEVWNPFLLLVVVGGAILGLFLFFRGLMKLVEASQGGSRDGFGPGLTHIVVAAFLIALPDAAGMGMTSILGAAKGGTTLSDAGLDYNDTSMTGNFLDAITGGTASVGAVENCIAAEAPATCMARNIARNIVPMAIMALFSLVFIVGLIAFASALAAIARSSERGERGTGVMSRLVTSILLMNSPLFFSLATTTLLGDIDSPLGSVGHLNAGSSLLTYPTESTLEIVQRYTELIGHSFTILAFFGAWAFVRGIFMIKSVAEAGRQGGSYGMAATYIIAGILLANSKFSACLILGSVGGEGMGLGFCT